MNAHLHLSPSQQRLAVAGGLALLVYVVWRLVRIRSLVTRPKYGRHEPIDHGFRATGSRYLVTGGFGLLGSHVIEALLARGEKSIHVLDLVRNDLFAEEEAEGTVTVFQGSLEDSKLLDRALQGVDVVIHTAALVDFWSSYEFESRALYNINYKATLELVEKAKKVGVKKFLHTSSCSVVLNKNLTTVKPVAFMNEDNAPLATPPFLCQYIRTKADAERAVCAANDNRKFLTGAIRPGGIFGPRDTLISGPITEGKPTLVVKSSVVTEMSYVENVVHAFFCLENKLTPNAVCCGKAYFIGFIPRGSKNLDDFTMQSFLRKMALEAGRPLTLVPQVFATTLPYVVDFLVFVTRGYILPFLGDLGKLRPSVITLSGTSYFFDSTKAEREIGYRNLVDMPMAITRTVEYFRKHAAATAAAAAAAAEADGLLSPTQVKSNGKKAD